MQQLIHFPSSHPYLDILKRHQACVGWKWSTYSIPEAIDAEKQVFVLFSPMEVGEKIIAPDHIWRQYLRQRQPRLKFFNVSIYPGQHPNYLFLFDLPINFSNKIENALTLNEEWDPFVFGAIDARDRLRDFLLGHGGMSFYKPLYRLQSLIVDIIAEKTTGVAYLETWGELGADTLIWWTALYTRWQLYLDFFTILPLQKEVEAVDFKLQQIKPFFDHKGMQEHLLYDLECDAALRSITQNIKILESYAAH